MRFALNQKTVKTLPFEAFLDLAAGLGMVGIEARNDLGRPFFDGIAPVAAGRIVRDRGLRLGVNDSWIAATAIAHGLSIVTQDTDYHEIPGLEVIKV